MKKNYETPAVEVVEFNYSDQVVAISGCLVQYGELHDIGVNDCRKPIETGEKTN